MVRESRRARPEVVTLEGRTLLSRVAAHAAVPAQVSKPRPHHQVELYGTTANTVVLLPSKVVQITGSGKFGGMGPVTLTSSTDARSEKSLLQTPWLLHADAVLTNAQGTVSVRVTPGTLGLDPYAQPVHLQYTITGGTGAYAGAVGTGLVDLRLAPGMPSLNQYTELYSLLKKQGVKLTLDFHPGKLNKFGDFSSLWYGLIETAVHASPHDSSSSKAPVAAQKTK
jgi:hypothetical protein